jgi:hypothetical protein
MVDQITSELQALFPVELQAYKLLKELKYHTDSGWYQCTK